MKKLKHRGNSYVVIRELDGARTAVLGTFGDAVEADDFCGAMAAEWFDKTKGAPASFSVVITTHYA